MLADTFRKLENRLAVFHGAFETLPLDWCENGVPNHWLVYEERASDALKTAYPTYDFESRERLALMEAVFLARFSLLFGEEVVRLFVRAAEKESMTDRSEAFAISRRFAAEFGEDLVREIAAAIFERAKGARRSPQPHRGTTWH